VSTLPRRIEVERLRDELLAGTGLAGDQNRCVGSRHPANGLVHVEHLVASTDDPLRRIARTDLGAQDLDLGRQILVLEKALDGNQHVFELERLGNVVVGTKLDRLDRDVRGSKGSHEDDRHFEALLTDPLQDVHPGQFGHPQIHQQEINLAPVGDEVHDFPTRSGLADCISLAFQEAAQQIAYRSIVVGNQDVSFHHRNPHGVPGARPHSLAVISIRSVPGARNRTNQASVAGEIEKGHERLELVPHQRRKKWG